MLNIPEEIKELFKSDNISETTQKKFRLTFYDDSIDSLYPYETLFPDEGLFPAEHGEPWLVIENDRIESESLKITESLSESENLEYGSCETAMMEIVVADVIEDITGREFTLTVEIGGYLMALGVYTVKSFVRQADRRKRKITAYDRMEWFNTDVSTWYNEISFPVTLKNFRNSLFSYIGLRQFETDLIFDSMQISKTISPEELSGIDVIKAICQINGCFGHVDKTGEFNYIHLQQTGIYPAEDLFPDEELFPAEFGGDGKPIELIERYRQGMTYEDYLVEGITGVSIRQEENDVGANVGSGENSYAVEGNFLVYGKSSMELTGIAETLFSSIEGRVYRPAKIVCNAMPWIEVGDAIRIPTRDDIVETFVMKRVMSGCQAMQDSVESTGKKKREEVFGINKKILQLEGKATVIVSGVEGLSVRVTDLKAQEESHFEITSNAIQTEVARAQGEEQKLSSSITQTAESITLKITEETKRAQGEEQKLSSSITQTAESITTEVTRATEAEKSLSSRITQNAESIALKVSKGDVTDELNSELKITGNSIELTTGHFTIDASNLKLDSSGNAEFSGKLKAAGGSFIGEMNIEAVTDDEYPILITYKEGVRLSRSLIGAGGFYLTVDEGSKTATYMKIGFVKDSINIEGGSYMDEQNEDTPSAGGGGSWVEPDSADPDYMWRKNVKMSLASDGQFKANWIYDNTRTDAGNVYISSNGFLYRSSSSSRRYKTDESTNLGEINPSNLYKTPVKVFRYIPGYLADGDPCEGKLIIGFIAEDLLETFPCAVQYENGRPETWNERIMVPAMLKLIQDLNERLTKLEEFYESNHLRI